MNNDICIVEQIIKLINNTNLPDDNWGREQFAITISCTIMEIIAPQYLDSISDSYDEKMQIFYDIQKIMNERIALTLANKNDYYSVN